MGNAKKKLSKYEGYKSDSDSKSLFSKDASTMKLVKSIEEKYNP